MRRAAAMILVLGLVAGCAIDDRRAGLAAWLAPICVFNCVVSVTYAPGVERLATEIQNDATPHR